jgi:outer membrane protein
MKKLPLILNVALAVAVIVLYVLFFTSKSGKSATGNGSDAVNATQATGGIVFIDVDSVYAKYAMYKDVVGDLEQKMNTAQAQFESKQQSFQKNVDDYKYKAERQLVTRSEAAQIEQSLQQEQQELMGLQNELQNKLAEEQQVAQRKVLNSIMEYLKGMENAGNYQFILGNAFGSNIMYANEGLNVTQMVIEGLNAEYKKKLEDSK